MSSVFGWRKWSFCSRCENGVGTPNDEWVFGVERNIASKRKACSVAPLNHDEPPRSTLAAEW